jgi:malyl-CoA/(S)-citramalyl-CoA lyase
MAETHPAPRRNRLQRSELAVPATSEAFFEKAARGQADAIFIDLEDAVAPSRKAEGRRNAIAALNEIDWGSKLMAVRVNALDTPWGVRDLIEVVDRCPRLDMVLLPKVGSPSDVEFVDTLIGGLERDLGRPRQIGIEVLIETAMGLAHCEAIAAASPRLEAMIFGVGDYSVDLRNFDRVFGASNPAYSVLTAADAEGRRHRHWNDQWHYALARIVNACRAYGLRPIDGPFTDYSDAEAYLASAGRAAALGFEGKWAIHPSQVELANQAFSPTADEVAWAERIAAAIAQANTEGKGALSVDGALVDMAHAKLAEAILSRAQAISGR